MPEEKLNNALTDLKMLLGIKDGEQDSLLSFLLEDAENLILGYCRIDEIPQKLVSVAAMVAADMYRAKGYGNESAPEVVKSISEGDRSVSYAETTPKDDFLVNYYERLKPFVNRRGRLPSDVKPI